MSLYPICNDCYDTKDSFYKIVHEHSGKIVCLIHDNSYEFELKILTIFKRELDTKMNYFIIKDINLATRLISIILQPFKYNYKELKSLYSIDQLDLKTFNGNHYKHLLKKHKYMILYFNNCEKHLPDDIKKDFPKITPISHTKKLIIDNKPTEQAKQENQIIKTIKSKKITRRTTKKRKIIEEDENDLFI